MSTNDYNDMLNKIKSTKDKVNEGITKHLLKIDIPDNIITGRFLPNLKDINEETGDIPTEFSHYFHFINSKLDNSTIYLNCLNTVGKRCPVCTKSIYFYRNPDPIQKARSKPISRKHNFITNFYVISDLKNPQNNGKVMLIKYGKQIDMKIKSALEGELSKFYGTKIYRLDSEGCSFMIKPEKNSAAKDAWTTYTNSSFLPAGPIDGMTEEKMAQIMDSIIAITPLHNKCKTEEEMNEILNKHYLINDIAHQTREVVNNVDAVTTSSTPTTPSSPKSSDVSEDELDKMLQELG